MYNGILIVDKPEGISSHTVINKLRRILGQKRLGHGGTLDPMATGVLPVFAGRATKAAEYVQANEKTYIARMKLGVITDTQDMTGEILQNTPCSISREQMEATLRTFRGETLQVPPMYSAVQVNGVRLYKLARSGQEIERPARPIRVDTLEITAVSDDCTEYELRVACSKGTFIRTLCADIGDALGCGAAVSSLRRVQTGMFSIAQAHTLEQIAEYCTQQRMDEILLGTDILFPELPVIHVIQRWDERLRRGASAYLSGKTPGRYRVYGVDGIFLGVGIVRETDRRPELMLEKGLFEEE